MYRSHPSIVPVANKYLAHKKFLQEQEDHKHNIKNAHGLLDQSSPPSRPHCYERARQKQIKEYELTMIERENARLRTRMLQNGAFVSTHNNLNTEKRHRDEVEHKNEIERLQKQISHVRTNYSTRDYQNDFAKQQDFKRRISKFPPNNK
ncbi:unnamed protein product [Rotaria sp. Silwood2]|nr:unnamed protein product [Rotaria sp. Silwood2]CAF2605616.1 unnamed protein product [Rotaria sp. Silwood2]CAF3252827.1 unnamed protein product [Rotaria sp. Silwood2]CAF4236655.1 unnamed protein product [Rotaria sp. Silwood2]CAF4285493.1 unnamed protein product [Rotaria sp. Silwood2]